MSDKEMALMLLDLAKTRYDEMMALLDKIKDIDSNYFDELEYSSAPDIEEVSSNLEDVFFSIEKGIRYWG